MALAAATGFVAGRAALQPSAVIVDHQLQPGSAEVAQRAAAQLEPLGIEPALVRSVTVDRSGGPEAAARAARYAAIDQVATEIEAATVLLGHTLDDQAESVLLGLTRGSGAGSIKGMSTIRGIYRRPLLSITRATTRAACDAMGLDYWDDPHNEDNAFARVRVRQHVMPVLETELGPGVAPALARTAELLQADDEALGGWATEVRLKAQQAHGTDGALALDVDALAQVPVAVRLRVVRAALLDAGVPGGDLRASHLGDVEALVSRWKGQGEVHLPGSIRVSRSYGRLLIARTPHQDH